MIIQTLSMKEETEQRGGVATVLSFERPRIK